MTFSEHTGNEVMVGHSDHLFVISLPLISFLFRYCVDVFTHFVAYPHFPTLLSDFSASELLIFGYSVVWIVKIVYSFLQGRTDSRFRIQGVSLAANERT